MRSSANFNNVQATRHLYCSLVKPHLEYISVIQSPDQIKYKLLIERVQYKFFRSAAYKSAHRIDIRNQNYIPILKNLNLVSLEYRKRVANMMFLFRFINGNIGCPQLLELINFYAASRAFRFSRTFLPVTSSSRLQSLIQSTVSVELQTHIAPYWIFLWSLQIPLEKTQKQFFFPFLFCILLLLNQYFVH